MKYIDAERLKVEIEKRRKFHDDAVIKFCNNRTIALTHSAGLKEDEELIELIESLQQEQPAQKKNCAGCPHCIDRKDQYGWHFKGCFGGPYKGKFIAEIDECPLQQEQPSDDLEEAAEKSSAQYYVDAGYSPFPNVETAAHKSGFIAGAEWQKLKDEERK